MCITNTKWLVHLFTVRHTSTLRGPRHSLNDIHSGYCATGTHSSSNSTAHSRLHIYESHYVTPCAWTPSHDDVWCSEDNDSYGATAQPGPWPLQFPSSKHLCPLPTFSHSCLFNIILVNCVYPSSSRPSKRSSLFHVSFQCFLRSPSVHQHVAKAMESSQSNRWDRAPRIRTASIESRCH